MKKYLLGVLGFIFFNAGFTQEFSKKEVEKLNSFGINKVLIELNIPSNAVKFENILIQNRKRKARKYIGFGILSLSAVTVFQGIRIISENRNEQEGLGQSIGTMIVVLGVVEVGATIPIFISSHKKKKERDNLIHQFN